MTSSPPPSFNHPLSYIQKRNLVVAINIKMICHIRPNTCTPCTQPECHDRGSSLHRRWQPGLLPPGSHPGFLLALTQGTVSPAMLYVNSLHNNPIWLHPMCFVCSYTCPGISRPLGWCWNQWWGVLAPLPGSIRPADSTSALVSMPPVW